MLSSRTRSVSVFLAVGAAIFASSCASSKVASTASDATETTVANATETTAANPTETTVANATETTVASEPAVAADGADAALAALAKKVPDAIRKKGSMSFAMDASYPPFESFDTDNKTIIGFDADLSTAIAAKLGLKAEHVNAGFDTILVGLAAAKYDVGMSAFSVTPERTQSVDFVVYLNSGTGIDGPTGNPMKLSMDPNSLCGHKVSAQKGSVQGLDYLPKFSTECKAAGKGEIDIQLYPSQTDANLAVTSGRADAVMGDSVSMAAQAKGSNGSLELAPGDDYDPSEVGLATVKGSPIAELVSEALTSLNDDGSIAKLLTKWEIPAQSLTSAQVGKVVK
jgi:polar amino acid transport system substrate-binding protein